ncbi:hypothetical protein [Cognatilysobacter bugurensis]|uniref:Uncharacterized protein n=1 Tax=Cognatilysobacter bugurensis TaxID=543356 RepID=A0A918T1X8_9GAMM|nr:hypothetical protein [Lysobacter bugurensis]GHA82904.1 hypothetical protein GCM10007067_21200 [Lysobacter bugurensis]
MIRALTASLLLLPALAFASDPPAPAPSEAPQAVAVDKDAEKLICRSEKKIGSNRPERVCRTKAELERARSHSDSQMRHPQNGG